MDYPSRDDTPSLGQKWFEYDAMDRAIRDGDVDRFSELANAIDDAVDFHWWHWAITRTEKLDPILRKDICAVLMNRLSREHLCYFLHNSLKISRQGGRTPLLILGQHPDLFIVESEGDCAFRLAVTNGQLEVLNMFLNLVEPRGWQEFIVPGATGITDGMTILELAAGKGHTEVVKALVGFDQRLLDHGYPLQMAISRGHLDVIEYLLSIKVELVEKVPPESEPLSVLSVPRREGIETGISEKIDNLLVSAIIKGRGQFQSPAMIRKLLKGSPVQHREICLDLSMFGRPTHKFKPMVDGLVQEDRLPNLGFLTTLAYVRFPYVDPSHPHASPESVGPDAERVLQWLRVTKGVSEIIRLIVPGSTPWAEREQVVCNAIRGISIVSLDWRVLDLSISIILDSESKNVEELCLYSSGNWGVLQHWSGTEGVKLLPNLKRLKIVFVKGVFPQVLEQEYIEGLERRLCDSSLADLKGRPLRSPPAPEVHVSIETRGWREINHPGVGV